MKKSLIFLMLIVLVGCTTVQKQDNGFSYVQKATELTAFEYLAMSDSDQKAIANGFLHGLQLLHSKVHELQQKLKKRNK